jgi:hypothetical protein
VPSFTFGPARAYARHRFRNFQILSFASCERDASAPCCRGIRYTRGEVEHADDGREGLWPRHQLENMDRCFVERVERAIARGNERLPCVIVGHAGPVR